MSTQPTPHREQRRPATSVSPKISEAKSTATAASPIDLVSRLPAARRMSTSRTGQSTRALPPSFLSLNSLLSHPQFVMAALLSIITLLGTAYGVVHDTALDTSTSNHRHVERTAYLARKSNIFNQLFVKKAWGWTTLAFVSHFVSSPPSVASRAKRLLSFVLATTAWIAFTTWFFGAGLGDRVIALSGGSCAIVIPNEWGLSISSVSDLVPSGHHAIDIGDDFLLPLPHDFCSARLPVNPSTHPDLFALIPTRIAAQGKVIPRWHRGFDISGHVFLLTLSAIVLARELGPSWRYIVRRPAQTGTRLRRGGRLANVAATVFGTLLLGLWGIMLGSTAVYFHHPSEKLTGLVLGLSTAGVVNILSPINPRSLGLASSATTALARDKSEPVQDENAARRGDGEEHASEAKLASNKEQ